MRSFSRPKTDTLQLHRHSRSQVRQLVRLHQPVIDRARNPNFVALEYHARDVPWWEDLVTRTGGDGPVIEDGTVSLPEGPGLGIEIDPDVAAEYLVEGETLVL